MNYPDAEYVETPLLDGSLGAICGDGSLTTRTIAEISNMDYPYLDPFHGKDVKNFPLLLNSQRHPLRDFRACKLITHDIDKKRMINKELKLFLIPVGNFYHAR